MLCPAKEVQGSIPRGVVDEGILTGYSGTAHPSTNKAEATPSTSNVNPPSAQTDVRQMAIGNWGSVAGVRVLCSLGLLFQNLHWEITAILSVSERHVVIKSLAAKKAPGAVKAAQHTSRKCYFQYKVQYTVDSTGILDFLLEKRFHVAARAAQYLLSSKCCS